MRDERDVRDKVYEREERVFERLVPVRGEKAVEPMDFLEKTVEESDDKKKCRQSCLSEQKVAALPEFGIFKGEKF
jgi:hypothetical protein